MPGCRIVLLSTVMTASVRWRAFPGRMSCRSHVPVTFYTASSPTGTQSRRWPRRCWAQRNGRWRSPTTARMVSAVAWGHRRITWHQPAAVGYFQNARRLSPKSSIVWSFFYHQMKHLFPTWAQKKQRNTAVLLHVLVQPESLLVLTKCNLEHSVAANQWVHQVGTLRGERTAAKVSFLRSPVFEMM